MAFKEESEIKQGYVQEFDEPQRSYLIIDKGNGIARGKARYAFRVTLDGKVLFQQDLSKTGYTDYLIKNGRIEDLGMVHETLDIKEIFVSREGSLDYSPATNLKKTSEGGD